MQCIICLWRNDYKIDYLSFLLRDYIQAIEIETKSQAHVIVCFEKINFEMLLISVGI